MNDKTLIGIGIVAVATPVLAFCIFGGMSAPAGSAPSTAATSAAPQTSTLAQAPRSEAVVSKVAAPPQAGALPASAIPVTPADLEKLAQMVQLSDKPDQKIDKEKWAKAIPAAEKLLTQSADCEQRNWLTQFVALGNYALEGSTEFQTYAPSLATMYRDNNELATGVPSN